MINREQLKNQIDLVDENHIETLFRIIQALGKNVQEDSCSNDIKYNNPLKGSVVFEKDLISPINDLWDSEQ